MELTKEELIRMLKEAQELVKRVDVLEKERKVQHARVNGLKAALKAKTEKPEKKKPGGILNWLLTDDDA